MELADLESEMYEVLYKCVMKYDPDKGATFNTFLWQGVYNRFRTILRTNSADKRSSMIEIPFDPISDPSEFVDHSVEQAIHRMIYAAHADIGADTLYEIEQSVRQQATTPARKRELARVAA